MYSVVTIVIGAMVAARYDFFPPMILFELFIDFLRTEPSVDKNLCALLPSFPLL